MHGELSADASGDTNFVADTAAGEYNAAIQSASHDALQTVLYTPGNRDAYRPDDVHTQNFEGPVRRITSYGDLAEMAFLPRRAIVRQENTDDKPTLAVLIETQQQIEAAAGSAAEKVRAVMTACSNAAQGAVNERLTQYAETYGHQPGEYERLSVALDTLHTTAGGHHEAIKSLPVDVQSVLKAAAAAEQASLPQATALLDSVRDAVVDTTDWPQVIAKKLAGEGYDTLEYDIASVADNPETRHSLRSALDGLSQATRLQAEITSQGDRLPEGTEPVVPKDWEPRADVALDMCNYAAASENVLYFYVSDERREFLADKLPGTALRALAAIAEAGGTRDEEGQLMLPPALDTAIQQRALALGEMFEAADRQQLARFGVDAPTILPMRRVDILQEKISLLSPELWVQDRLSRYPANLRRGWQAVEFYDDPSVVTDHMGAMWTTGRISTDNITLHLNVTSGSPTDIGDTVDHEQMHFMHLYHLPVEVLTEWERICAAEPVAAFAEPNQEPGYENTEDLSNSGEMYMNEPWNLIRDGKIMRFAFFQKLLGRYDTTAVMQAFEVLPAGSGDEKAIRDINRRLVREADRAAYKNNQQL